MAQIYNPNAAATFNKLIQSGLSTADAAQQLAVRKGADAIASRTAINKIIEKKLPLIWLLQIYAKKVRLTI